jgi:hypothetical protein
MSLCGLCVSVVTMMNFNLNEYVSDNIDIEVDKLACPMLDPLQYRVGHPGPNHTALTLARREKVMEKLKRIALLLGLATLGLLLSLAHGMAMGSRGKDSVRITADQLKAMLGRPDVLVVDVRDPISWDKSNGKIPGAVREDPDNAAAWSSKVPKDKTIVLYCA